MLILTIMLYESNAVTVKAKGPSRFICYTETQVYVGIAWNNVLLYED